MISDTLKEISSKYLDEKNTPIANNEFAGFLLNCESNKKEIEVIETSGRIAQAKQVGNILKELSTTELGWVDHKNTNMRAFRLIAE